MKILGTLFCLLVSFGLGQSLVPRSTSRPVLKSLQTQLRRIDADLADIHAKVTHTVPETTTTTTAAALVQVADETTTVPPLMTPEEVDNSVKDAMALLSALNVMAATEADVTGLTDAADKLAQSGVYLETSENVAALLNFNSNFAVSVENCQTSNTDKLAEVTAFLNSTGVPVDGVFMIAFISAGGVCVVLLVVVAIVAAMGLKKEKAAGTKAAKAGKAPVEAVNQVHQQQQQPDQPVYQQQVKPSPVRTQQDLPQQQQPPARVHQQSTFAAPKYANPEMPRDEYRPVTRESVRRARPNVYEVYEKPAVYEKPTARPRQNNDDMFY